MTAAGQERTTYTQEQGTDEAILLFTRKMRRLFSKEFNEVWANLPVGAQEALLKAEMRADRVRDTYGPFGHLLNWQIEEDEVEDGEE